MTVLSPSPSVRVPYLFYHISQAAEDRQELIALGAQSALARLARAMTAWRSSRPPAAAPSPGQGGRPGLCHTPTSSQPSSSRRAARQASHGAPVRVEQTPRVEAIKELVRRLGHDGRICHIRDEHYLAGRDRNPLHELSSVPRARSVGRLPRAANRPEGSRARQQYRGLGGHDT